MNLNDFKVGMVFEGSHPANVHYKRWVRIVEVVTEPVPKVRYHSSYKGPEGPYETQVVHSCVRLHTFFKGLGAGRFMLVWEPDGSR